ncbi:MAG TPA: hypothetical protein VFJ59_01610 [Pseudolabrys sp.]|nr:hypothetical protein [Pseudolabrys sp.]
MRWTFRLKDITAASLLSCVIAGAFSALTGPVTADNAAVVTISVNRITKGDRLPLPLIAEPTAQHNSISIERPIPARAPLGCEPAFSPFADPARAHILASCLA